VPEALDEHLLRGILQMLTQRRIAPAGSQIRADGAEVAACQLVAVE
jgi:hypothetical protein